MLMASVMARKSKLFGRRAEEIGVLVEVECQKDWLCCEQKYLKFILVQEAAQDRRSRKAMVPSIGCHFGLFEDD